MKEFNPTETHFESASASALDMFSDGKSKVRYPAYIGLDVHKETIAVAVARAGRDAPESWGEIAKQAEGGRQAGSTLTFLSRSILVR